MTIESTDMSTCARTIIVPATRRRILFTTTGHSGHMLPLLPFARAAVRAGHDVRIAAQATKVAAVGRAGFPAVPLAEAPRAALEPLIAALGVLPLSAADARGLADGFVNLAARAALPDVLAAIDAWGPDLLVRESYEFAGPLAAELRGVPCARVGLGMEATEDWTIELARAALDAWRTELGLAPDPTGAALRGLPYLTGTPAAFEAPVAHPRGPVHRFRSGTPPVARVPSGGAEPLVYVTLGTVAGGLPSHEDLLRAVIGALAPLPLRLLVTVGRDADARALGALPPNVRLESWVAQDTVLPHAAAVVCHGGYGTTLGALAHGVPLVITPLFAGDQWQTARRVAELGAGEALEGAPRAAHAPPGADVLDALADAVRRVLAGPQYVRAAREVARAVAALAHADEAPTALRLGGPSGSMTER